MQTWSAVRRFSTEKKYNPLNLIMDELEKLWGNRRDQKVVKWYINIRVGKIQN
jgi:hypothetical protein